MNIYFKKVHTVKDLVLSVVVTLAGIGLYFLNQGLGGVVFACGLLMLIFYKAGYKANGEGPVLTKKAQDLPRTCRQSIVNYLEGKDDDLELGLSGLGASVRLETYYNKEAGVAYVQLFDFSNYTYEPATEIVELHSPKADNLLSKL